MKRVLFVVLPERGHIHPFLGAAEALRARGTLVSFYSPRDVRSILAPFDFHDVYAPDDAGAPAEEAMESRGAAFAELLADATRLRAWIRAMLVDAAPRAIAPLRKHLASARPDVMVIDPMAYFAAIAAHEEGIPWVGLSTSLNPCIRDDVESELLATLRELHGDRVALFREHGMPAARFRVSDVLSPRGTIVLSTPALVGTSLPDDGVPVHLVGAALAASSAARGSHVLAASPSRGSSGRARPLVYASFGSQAYHQPARLQVLLEAARHVDARFVIAMGELASTALAASAPPSVECVAFAPQASLLEEARVAVTHGGANSVHEALAFGVPLLVSPICNDQHHNADLVARSGAGRIVDLACSNAGAVASALRALLLEDAPERRAAGVIARSYAAAGGASRIADIVLEAT